MVFDGRLKDNGVLSGSITVELKDLPEGLLNCCVINAITHLEEKRGVAYNRISESNDNFIGWVWNDIMSVVSVAELCRNNGYQFTIVDYMFYIANEIKERAVIIANEYLSNR